ncbi:MAG: GNAT family N-acetyltransferase [Bacteroidales bacterium]|nr:GNAT family N-acetyltransferase [Bacteroidales bacterium]
MGRRIIGKNGDVLIREFNSEDAAQIAALANNRKISRNLTDAFPNPYTIEEARKFLARMEKQDPKTWFAIEYQGKYAGNISLAPGKDIYRKSAEIGYFIGEPFWNKGIATQAINLIVDFGFYTLDLVRIHCGIFSFNAASARVLEKNGFNQEGVFRKAMMKEGTVYDEIRFAIVKED